MADQIKIEIDVETRAAIAELAKIEKATREVEKEVKKLTLAQTLWKAANTDLNKITKDWQDVGETVGKIGGAFVGAAAGAALLYRHIDQQEQAFRRLGAAYNSVSFATAGMVSAQEALQLQQQIVQSGTQVTSQQLATLTRGARDFAQATGGEVTQALDMMANAIINNSEDALQSFGLAAQRAGTGAGTLSNVVQELARRHAEAGPPTRSFAEDLTRAGDGLAYLGQKALEAATGGVATLLEKLGLVARSDVMQLIRNLASASDDARGRASMAAASAAGTARFDARDRLYSAMQEQGARLNSTSQAQFGNLSSLSESERGRVMRAITMWSASGASSASESLNRELAAISEGRLQTEVRTAQTASDARETALSAERKGRRNRVAGSGGGGDASAIRSAREAYNAAVADGMARDAVLVLPDDMPRNSGETLAAYFTRLADIQREFNSAGATNDLAPTNAAEMQSERDKAEAAFAEDRAGVTRGRERTQRRSARDLATRRDARLGSIGGRTMSALGFSMDAEGRSAGFDSMAEGASLLTGTVNSLTSGLTQLFDTLVTGSMDAGTAFQTFASGLLTELGKMAVQKGLFYTFEGIAALFTAPPAAPLYFAAGAGLLALGAGLGAAGAASKPATPAASAGAGGTQAARGLAPRSSLGSSMGELGAVTVVQSSLVPAGPVDAQRARDGLRTVRRQGFGDRAPRRIEH